MSTDARAPRDLRRAATAMGARQRLDALLLEALTAPGMALPEVEQITELASTGLLRRAQEALDAHVTGMREGA